MHYLCKVNEDGRTVSIRLSDYYRERFVHDRRLLKNPFIVPKKMAFSGRDYVVSAIDDGAFADCSCLTSVVIPDSVTWIGDGAFRGCSGLTSVVIPDSVIWIGDYAFSGCNELTSVVIPDSVTAIGEEAFKGCGNLESIVVGKGNRVYDSRENCNAIIETKTNKLLRGCKNTVIPNSVTSIGKEAFWGCCGLASIVIPDSINEIGAYAFCHHNIDSSDYVRLVVIPNSVKGIATYAFWPKQTIYVK